MCLIDGEVYCIFGIGLRSENLEAIFLLIGEI